MYRKVVVITQMMLAIFAINANSIFSFKKFPVRSSFADVYSIGMGGVGIGDLHRINSNQANPSLTISTKKVTFSSSVELGYNLYSDNQNSFTDNTFDIPYFNIIVPVINNRFFFNFNKYLSGNLKNQIDTDSYTEKQIIDSYLYNADIGYAYHHKIVNLGISSRFYMGHFTHYFEQDFVDEEMADTNFERYNELKSVAINIGFSRKLGKLSFGGFYSSSTNLAGKSELLFSQNVYLQDDEEFEFQLPARVGLGISYRAKNRMKYGFDIEYENWESTNSYDNSTNSTILKAGIAFDPLLGYGEWWQKIPLRFGVNYRNLPFEINENKVIETGGALGFSIPLKKNYQMIDCAIEYKKRGNQEDNGMQESSIMLNIGIQGFDIFHKKYNRTRKVDIPETDRFN